MRISLKLLIRDKVMKYPRTYKFIRASYHATEVFFAILAERKVVNKTAPKQSARMKRVFSSIFFVSNIEPKLTVAKRKHIQSDIVLDVIVPVFNRGDLALNLLIALNEQKNNIRDQIIVNLMCADDCSDLPTSQLLKELSANLGIDYIRRDENLGFIDNVNIAWNSCQGEFVLLLNSDVKISDGFLRRVLDPFLHDPTVGLSTHPTFELFATQLEPGINLNSLNRFLFDTSEEQVSFVDACTAVGYALAIRRSSIVEKYLFDPRYGRGYGEDSDLHYRIVNNGFRSVWNLDSCVSHLGAVSFDLTEISLAEKRSGRKLFLQLWGNQYLSEIDFHTKALIECIEVRTRGYSMPEKIENWIVLPTVSKNIGGIIVGCELAVKLSEKNPGTKILTIDDSEGKVVNDFFSVGRFSDILSRKASGHLTLVGVQALDLLRDSKFNNSNFEIQYFAQGPDWLIDPSAVGLFLETTLKVNRVLSVSEYMDKEMLALFPQAEIFRYVPDLDYAKFAGLSLHKKNTDFFLIYRSEFGKMGWLAIALANLLSQTHSVTLACAIQPIGLAKNVKIVLGPGRNQILKEFSDARVYIDVSLFEGFGLTPREAAFQNTQVLMLDSADGRLELQAYSSHFSFFTFKSSLFEIEKSALNILARANCHGCLFCTKKLTYN